MNTISVALKRTSIRYPIIIKPNLLDKIGDYVKSSIPYPASRIAIISDRNVARLYLRWVLTSLKRSGFRPVALVIPSGEGQKSLKQANALYNFLIKNRFERTDTILALGGGVVGDLAGFVAATFLRGVNFIQAPTTLLAMVDASIGGKVAVNHRFGKNLIGAFYQPKTVLIDPLALQTLPEREFYNGMAEVIKAAVIQPQNHRVHRGLFSFLKSKRAEIISRKIPVLEEMIKQAITIKRDIVQKDEFDRKGIREVLNYGHTIGHAIESMSGYKYRHGEAVALGMVAANNIGLKMGITNKGFAQELIELLKSYHLSIKNQFNQAYPLTKLLKRDKKVKSGKVRFVIPQTIGKVKTVSISSLE